MNFYLLDANDEFPHDADNSPLFNESVYVNGFDRDAAMGGWVRIGNRVGEGHAEVSICFYLPDGRIACQFQRPPIETNQAFSAGGLEVRVVEPLKELKASYSGELMLVDDPNQLRDAKSLFEDAPRVVAEIDWKVLAVSPAHGGRPASDDQPTMYGRDFSLNHYNQHVSVSGDVSIGEMGWAFNGHGWRDHSWGPRTWQAIQSYRLFVANFGNGDGFMLLRISNADGTSRRLGNLLVGGRYEEVLDFDITTRWAEPQSPSGAFLAVRTASRTASIEATMLSVAPLRNRRPAGGKMLMSRIWEGFTRFVWDGEEAFGMSEYLERLDEGRLPGDII